MTTASDVAQYRKTQTQLETVAFGQVNTILDQLKGVDPVTVRNTLILALPETIGPYLTASGDLAATWYEDLRRAALGGTFYATSVGEVNAAQVNALVRWGVRPLFGQSTATVLSLIGGGVQRMIADAGRDTVRTNVMRERVRVGYARIPQPGCCAFCALLASRGAVYNSAASAGGVVGRGSVRTGFDASGERLSGGIGGGVVARGSQAVGKEFHDFDRCVVVPSFDHGNDPVIKDTREKYMDMYRQGGVTANAHGHTVTTLESSLAGMRENLGLK